MAGTAFVESGAIRGVVVSAAAWVAVIPPAAVTVRVDPVAVNAVVITASGPDLASFAFIIGGTACGIVVTTAAWVVIVPFAAFTVGVDPDIGAFRKVCLAGAALIPSRTQLSVIVAASARLVIVPFAAVAVRVDPVAVNAVVITANRPDPASFAFIIGGTAWGIVVTTAAWVVIVPFAAVTVEVDPDIGAFRKVYMAGAALIPSRTQVGIVPATVLGGKVIPFAADAYSVDPVAVLAFFFLNLGFGLNEAPVGGHRGRRLRLEKLLVVRVGRRRLSQDGGGNVGVLRSLSKRNESDEFHVLNS